MRLILARHGATFLPGAQAVWLGGDDDPPLAPAGLAQAQALAQALQAARAPIAAVWASPLMRARTSAAIAWPGPPAPQLSAALGEIDYGRWAGRSYDQLRADGWGEALDAWAQRGDYPPDALFSPDAATVQQQWRAWLQTLGHAHPQPDATVLAVSHHGRLRQLHKMLAAPEQATAAKMACGHLALLRRTQNVWHIDAWNVAPEAAALAQWLGAPSPLR